jgi:hypothetical protein
MQLGLHSAWNRNLECIACGMLIVRVCHANVVEFTRFSNRAAKFIRNTGTVGGS